MIAPRRVAARRLPAGEQDDVEVTTPVPAPHRAARALRSVGELARSAGEQAPQVRDLQKPARSEETAGQDDEQDPLSGAETGAPGRAPLAS